MDLATRLFLSVLFGSIGIGYFIYGRRQKKAVPMLAGLALCAYLYFVSSIYSMLAIGVVLIALPFFVRE